MREPSSPFASSPCEADGDRLLRLNPCSSLCQAFCGKSPQGGLFHLRLWKLESWRVPQTQLRIVRGDPLPASSTVPPLRCRASSNPYLATTRLQFPSAVSKTPCAERGDTTDQTKHDITALVNYLMKALLVVSLVPCLPQTFSIIENKQFVTVFIYVNHRLYGLGPAPY